MMEKSLLSPVVPLAIAMPNDDELYAAFIDAIKNGVHEGIRGTVDKITGYIETAKDEIKNLIFVDPDNGLVLDMTIAKWDQILAVFVMKQGWLMRNALKLLLAATGASTFTKFVAKMKTDPSSKTTTITTLTRIMTLFFATLGTTYLTKETEATIYAKIDALFA